MFVCELDGKTVASGIINELQPDAYRCDLWGEHLNDSYVLVLHTLVVSPDAMGRGIGRKFVAFYESYSRGHGYRALRIDTQAKNLRARKMYAVLGFREVGIVTTDSFNGLPPVQLVLLEKCLSTTSVCKCED